MNSLKPILLYRNFQENNSFDIRNINYGDWGTYMLELPWIDFRNYSEQKTQEPQGQEKSE